MLPKILLLLTLNVGASLHAQAISGTPASGGSNSGRSNSGHLSSARPQRGRPVTGAGDVLERRATTAFAKARESGVLDLHAFLEAMPKGADLHMHLSGAVYAETLLDDAAADLLCVDPKQLTLVKNVGTTRSLPPQAVCAEGTVAAQSVYKDQRLYDALIDAFSMRSFVASAGVSAHDQFFATFDRYHGLGTRHLGEWLDEVATRAAKQNVQYLEIMHTPNFSHARKLGVEIGWPASAPAEKARQGSSPVRSDGIEIAGATHAELAALRDKLLAGGLRDEVEIDRAEFSDALATRNTREHCGVAGEAAPACSVEIRFLFQVLRAAAPEQVFAQTLLAFEVASADPDVVGLNFVQPEDAYLAMHEYTRQMRMLDYLHTVYPKVHIALHAGELAPGLVPPTGLEFHIREAVEIGHAERIGHGVDLMYETEPKRLLEELSSRHVMVEINLTSNDVILGVAASQHPLPEYRAAHVPVALSTDDEGVSRIDLTHEYTRAATDFGLTYLDLKQVVRTSLEHTFLAGASLWRQRDDFRAMAPACTNQAPGADKPSPGCAAFLKGSPHAAQQWELERRYRSFESALP